MIYTAEDEFKALKAAKVLESSKHMITTAPGHIRRLLINLTIKELADLGFENVRGSLVKLK